MDGLHAPRPPGLCLPPRSRAALRQGIDILANLLRPTLGPLPRHVAVANALPNHAPELLDDGATILRRVIQLPDPYLDMGAMLLRHTAWRVHQTVGDGTAMTAVLMQSIVHQAARYVAAGGNPVEVRRGLQRGGAAILPVLRGLARPVERAAGIARLAETICHDAEVAALLGEIFETVGPDGYVEVREGQGRALDRQYVEGVHWPEGFISPHFVSEPDRQEARLDQPAVLISDLRLTAAEQLVPLLERAARAHRRSLMLIAQEVSGSALGLLVANHRAGSLRLLAVKAPSFGKYQDGILHDLAVLTGGRVVSQAVGERGQDVTLADLGQARQAWATSYAFGVMGGQSDPLRLRQQIRRLRAELAAASDATDRAKLQERLGRLLGGTAILWVGAATKTELAARRGGAEKAVRALARTMAGGVVPGGGSALLACQPALQDLPAPTPTDVGLKVLCRALEEPLRAIAGNAGHEPAQVVSLVRSAPPGWGFDARTGQLVDMWVAGILDSLPVIEMALQAAISGAVMALTTDVLVRRRWARPAFEP